MNKLIYILLLFISSESFGQVTIIEKVQEASTLGVGSTASTLFTAGKVYIACFIITNAGGTPATISISGGTWTQVHNEVFGNSRIMAFRWLPSSNTTTALTYSYTGTQDGTALWIGEVTGIDITGTNGENSIAQIVANSGTSADPNITLASITRPGGIVGFFGNNQNAFTGTPETDWTEEYDAGYGTPTTGVYAVRRNNTTDNTILVTSASSTWYGIGIEFKANRRRAFGAN